MTITAAVDGSSLGNPGPAGWAWVVDREQWKAGGWDLGTNNLGELTAVLELLRATSTDDLREQPLTILADSQYTINVVTKWSHGWKNKGWKKADGKEIANLDVIKSIDELMCSRPGDVSFEWVRGHNGHNLNEAADFHARSAAEAFRDGRPVDSGPGFGSQWNPESLMPREGQRDGQQSEPPPAQTVSNSYSDTYPPSDEPEDDDAHHYTLDAGSPDDGDADHTDADDGAMEAPTQNDDVQSPGDQHLRIQPPKIQVPEIHDQDIATAQQHFIRAWVAGDTETVGRHSRPDTLWVSGEGNVHRGRIPQPCNLNPATVHVSRIDVHRISRTVWMAFYRLSTPEHSWQSTTTWTIPDQSLPHDGHREPIPQIVCQQNTRIQPEAPRG